MTLKRPGIKQGTSVLKRTTGLAPMSAKAKKKLPARRAAMAIVRERDKGCQFEVRLEAWGRQQEGVGNCDDAEAFEWSWGLKPLPFCWHPAGEGLDGHEPVKRSQGADPTNPDEIVLLCRRHHGWVDDHPLAARELGL